MKKLFILSLMAVLVLSTLIPSVQAGEKWVIEPSIPDYSKRGLEAGSIMNPLEVHRGSNNKLEISTPFQDSSKPSLAPGQPLNPWTIEKR